MAFPKLAQNVDPQSAEIWPLLKLLEAALLWNRYVNAQNGHDHRNSRADYIMIIIYRFYLGLALALKKDGPGARAKEAIIYLLEAFEALMAERTKQAMSPETDIMVKFCRFYLGLALALKKDGPGARAKEANMYLLEAFETLMAERTKQAMFRETGIIVIFVCFTWG